MPDSPIIRTVELTAMADLDAARSAFAQLVEQTRAEPGCVHFAIHEIKDWPGHFMLWEHFADRAAYDAHYRADYTRLFQAEGWSRVRGTTELSAIETHS